jgi:predicted MFS family arabinose efflux permease
MYWQLLKQRPRFRNIWLGAVVSMAGDWFTLLALYSLLLERTGKTEAVGLMLAARFLPAVFFGPLAGVVADRLPRGRIMVACDLLRAVTVLAFLTESVTWVYPIVFLQMTLSSFFDPAEQAAIASTVEPDEIVTASTLHAATWSAMLSIGALVGGAAVTLIGRPGSFVVNAATYLLSALFISRAQVPYTASTAPRQPLGDFREGLKLLRSDAGVRRTLWVKTGWSIAGGGALVLYAVLGDREFAIAGSGAAGIGVLLACRGVGALVGPLVARRIGGDSPAYLRRAITFSYLIITVFWLLLAKAPGLALAAACTCLAHMGVSTQWTFSNSLIALGVQDRLRGRIFSLDMMFHTIVLATSSWAMGRLLDASVLTPRGAMAAVGAVTVVPLLVWLWLKPRERGSEPAPVAVPRRAEG